MAKSTTNFGKKRKRGPPPTGVTPTVTLRIPAQVIAAIDDWGRKSGTQSRTETLRILIDIGLATKPTKLK